MATVPNYYYNSPWMADIGRNLASALKPPDIDTLRAREQNAWQFEHTKTKAANEETDRANTIRSRAAIGKMYDLQKNPIMGADGKVDAAATEKMAFELADEAMTYGPKDVRAEVDEGLFNLSPTFARKKILQRQSEMFRESQLTRSLAGAINLAQVQGGIRGGLQDDAQEFEMMKMREMFALRGKEWQQRAYLKAKAAGLDPITITAPLADRMWLEIMKFEKLTGNKLTPEDRFALFGEATELAQTSRNPITAVHERWNTKFPYAKLTDIPTQEVQEPGIFDNWLGNTDPFLKPADAAPPAPTVVPDAVEPNSLGGAAVTPPPLDNPFIARGKAEAEMEAASRAAAAAETAALTNKPAQKPKAAGKKPKEGDRAKSKKGVPMIFHNGRWEADE